MLGLLATTFSSGWSCSQPVVLQRLQGKAVTFITGTDEHGEKIALAAEKQGLQPKEHCDRIVDEYKRLWEQVTFARAFLRASGKVLSV